MIKHLDSIQIGNEDRVVIANPHISNVEPFPGPYESGCVSIPESMLYLYPAGIQVSEPIWHRIKYDNDTIEEYVHGNDDEIVGYKGGCLSPDTQRSYLLPTQLQIDTTFSHYIDHTSNGELVKYNIPPHTPGDIGIYSPKENRVYFLPRLITPDSVICYIQEPSGLPTITTSINIQDDADRTMCRPMLVTTQ